MISRIAATSATPRKPQDREIDCKEPPAWRLCSLLRRGLLTYIVLELKGLAEIRRNLAKVEVANSSLVPAPSNSNGMLGRR
jgi:hypothetical protein